MKNTISFLLFCILSFLSCKKDNETIVPNTLSGTTKMLLDEFNGVPIVVTGNSGSNFIVAFERTLPDGTLLEFEVKQRALPIILTDNEENEWSLEGIAIKGPRKGQRLTPVNSYIGFWFAWSTMYPGIELYDGTPYPGGFTQLPPEDNWTIPTENVFNVLGLDGIPAIDEPKFEDYDEKDAINNGYFIEDDDLVIGITHNGTTRLYPHRILNWHEIVNDNIDNFYFSMSFCPITGTAILWDREIDGAISTFGVSGLLYNGNVMPYDRNTGSLWSQMRSDCVNGYLIGEKLVTTQVLETTWQTWKQLYEEPLVLTTDTGYGKDYTINPYEDYIADPSHLSYPIEYEDNRLSFKERVLGIIIDGEAKAYRFQDFKD